VAIAALGVLIGIWVVVDAHGRLRRLLAVTSREDRWGRGRVVLVHAGVQLGLFVVSLGMALFLVTVPAGLIGVLGFFPLLRGLGGLTSARFVVTPGEPVVSEKDGSLSVRTIGLEARAGGIDRVALFAPVLALATGGELIAAGVVLLGLLALVSAWALWRPGANSGGGGQERLLAWLQVLVGGGVLLVSGMLNWVFDARG
jgi:hypothetical protein